MCPTSSYLRALNQGDDTPGAPRYTTLWGSSDTVVPQSATKLDGGACYLTVPNVLHTAYEEDAKCLRRDRQGDRRRRLLVPGNVQIGPPPTTTCHPSARGRARLGQQSNVGLSAGPSQPVIDRRKREPPPEGEG